MAILVLSTEISLTIYPAINWAPKSYLNEPILRGWKIKYDVRVLENTEPASYPSYFYGMKSKFLSRGKLMTFNNFRVFYLLYF